MSATAEDVTRLRIAYIKQALRQVQRIMANSKVDGRIAASEVKRYFQWVEQDLPSKERQLLLDQMRALPK